MTHRRGAGVGIVEPVGVGEQHEQIGAEQVRDKRGKAVVVAVADLVVGDGVVLVDDRHDAEVEEAPHRLARVQVLASVAKVVRHEEHLAGEQPLLAERVVVDAHQTMLADRGERLERRRVRGPATGGPHRRDARGHRARGDDDHVVAERAAVPRPRRTGLLTAPTSTIPSSPVTDEVPIFATTITARPRHDVHRLQSPRYLHPRSR